jgi:putative endonuclease
MTEHYEGRYDGYTAARQPIRLLWTEEFVDVRDAIILERKIKKWTRKKKEALMKGDFQLLHELSGSTRTKTKLASSSNPPL